MIALGCILFFFPLITTYPAQCAKLSNVNLLHSLVLSLPLKRGSGPINYLDLKMKCW